VKFAWLFVRVHIALPFGLSANKLHDRLCKEKVLQNVTARYSAVCLFFKTVKIHMMMLEGLHFRKVLTMSIENKVM